jgi:hypothetical protein
MTIRTTTRLLLLAPIAWIPIALLHPMGGQSAYEALHDKIGLWVGIHFAQLAFALGVAALLWCLLDGLTTRGARAARVSLPIYLVTFAAYDGITGIGTGLVVKHANGATGAAREGAADAADYLLMNQISADLSPLHVISSVALVVAFIGTALALRTHGVARRVWLPVAFGLLIAMHAGPGTALGAACLAAGAWGATTVTTAVRSADAADRQRVALGQRAA